MFLVLIGLSVGVGATHGRAVRLIEQLADREFAVREAATRDLAAMPFAKPLVAQAALSPVPERAKRAKQVLATLETSIDTRLRARLDWWAVAGRFDLIAELANLKGGESHRALAEEYAYRAAARAYEWQVKVTPHTKLARPAYPFTEKQLADAKWRDPFKDISAAGALPRTFPEDHPSFRMWGGSYSGDNRVQLALTDGAVEARAALTAPVWITTGSAKICDGSRFGVFVADGDVDVYSRNKWFAERTPLGLCLIVSNGPKVRVSGGGTHLSLCVILAAGDVEVTHTAMSQCLIRAGGKMNIIKSARVEKDCDIKENVAEPLAPFKFFGLADVGLHAKADKQAVAVEKVDADSRFDKAGVRAGDVLLAVDGKAVAEVAELRRLVRTGYVRGDCTVKVRRGEATKELVVHFPE